MHVVFLEDVPNVAKAGQSKEVADGYGRNYLLPRKLAVLADSKAAVVVEAHLKALAHRRALVDAELREVAGKIEGKEIVLKARAGEKERLYGSITSADIAEALSKSSGYEIDKKKVELAEPVHQLGSYEITIRLGQDIMPKIKLTVVGEEEKEEKKAGEVAEGETKEETKEA